MPTSSPRAHSVTKRPPVARHPGAVAILTRHPSSRTLYKTGEKAATHDAMIQRFQLRRMSSSAGFPSKFGRANDVVIDKAMGDLQRHRRFSLRRSIRAITSIKTRRQVFRRLTSPMTPYSWASTAHGVVMLTIYHFQVLYLPFFVSYYRNGLSTVAIFLEIIFLLDLLLNFNTAYMKQGVIVKSRGKIAQQYMRKWFVFDLLSAVPVQSLYCSGANSIKCTNTAIRDVQILLMLLRLLRGAFIEKGILVNRVTRVAKHLVDWIRYSRYSHLLGIAQLMWAVLLVAHYMACIWHVVSGDKFTHAMQPKSVGEQYAADYYYAVSLIQGQGNSGGTWDENLYSSVAIIVGSVILAIVFGNVAMLVSNFNANSTNYHRKMEAVYATMDKMELPSKLRERVNEYYKHVWQEYEALDGNVNKFQQELTHTLGIEIGLYKHMNLVVKVPFWEDCTPDFLTQLVLNLGVRVYMPDDYVVRRREVGCEMMMVNRGYCKLSKPSKTIVDEKAAKETTTTDTPYKPVFTLQDLAAGNSVNITQATDDEEDSDDGSSDDETDEIFRGGMFGTSIDSRWMSRNSNSQSDTMNFTDMNRLRHVHPQRPSYPNGIELKKGRRHREYLHPGEAFGEMSLLMNYKRTANVRAVTFVEMCVLDRDTFQKIISRYPEDRRRVLTRMLESCIDKKLIPFPWEKIIAEVSTKRGKEDLSHSSVIASMTTSEAARILVEEIDVSTPDESIKYGFQSYDEAFLDDSSLCYSNSADTKISDRRNSVTRSDPLRDSSSDNRSSMSDTTELKAEQLADTSSSQHSSPTLSNLLMLMQSMADNIERLQKDVNDLKTRERRGCSCGKGGLGSINSQRPTASHLEVAPRSSRAPNKANAMTTKEDNLSQTSRKPSFVILPTASLKPDHHTGDAKRPTSTLRKIRSSRQESGIKDRPDHFPTRDHTKILPIQATASEVSQLDEPPVLETEPDRYPTNTSSRSKAARSPTLADILWKRSNTSGDLLKHTDEERNAARLRRQIRARHSLPSEVTAEQASPRADDETTGQLKPAFFLGSGD